MTGHRWCLQADVVCVSMDINIATHIEYLSISKSTDMLSRMARHEPTDLDPDIRLLAALADPTRLAIVRQLAAEHRDLRLRLHAVLRRRPADRLAPPAGPARGRRRDVRAPRPAGSSIASRPMSPSAVGRSPATSSRAG